MLDEGSVRSWKPWAMLEGGAPGGGGGGNPPADPPPGDPPPVTPPPGDPPAGAWHENTAWLDALPEGLKGSAEALEGLKGKPLGEVLAGYVQKSIDAAPPATPNDYGIALPASLAEVAKEPGAAELLNIELNRILTEAHADGMSKAQAQARVEREAKAFLADLAAGRKAAADASKALKEKWGDKYPEREAYTARALETFPEHLKKIATDNKLASDPFFVELMYIVGAAQQEGRLHQGDPGGKPVSDGALFYGGAKA